MKHLYTLHSRDRTDTPTVSDNRKPELLQLVENGQEETGEAVLAWRLVAVAAF